MTNVEFEKIYGLYFDNVYRYVLKICQNQSIAEEITSDTFFKALKSIDRFQGECDIGSWLCQIAKNTYYTYLRKNKSLVQFDFSIEKEDLSGNIEEKIVTSESVMSLYEILHLIEEPYKEVFMLRVFGELNFKQIGKIFGKTENWACVTYHRAKRKIQTKMEGYE